MADKRHLPLFTPELCALGGYFCPTLIHTFKHFPQRRHVSSGRCRLLYIVPSTWHVLTLSETLEHVKKLGRGLQGNSWHTVSTQQGFPWFVQFDVDIYSKSPLDVLYFQLGNYAFLSLSLWQLGFPSAKRIFSVIFFYFLLYCGIIRGIKPERIVVCFFSM